MLTKAENAEVGPVNDRMPLVLTGKAQYARWLDPEITSVGPVNDYLHDWATKEALVTIITVKASGHIVRRVRDIDIHSRYE